MTPELKSVTVEAKPDEYPSLDHLGEYRSKPGPDDRTIDRADRGDMGRDERRYFVSATAEYTEEHYTRMERFSRGELACYGIHAVATVSVVGTTQRVESPGLWGVESDTGNDHADTIASEQLHVLAETLDALGVDRPVPLEAEWADDAPWSGTVTE